MTLGLLVQELPIRDFPRAPMIVHPMAVPMMQTYLRGSYIGWITCWQLLWRNAFQVPESVFVRHRRQSHWAPGVNSCGCVLPPRRSRVSAPGWFPADTQVGEICA